MPHRRLPLAVTSLSAQGEARAAIRLADAALGATGAPGSDARTLALAFGALARFVAADYDSAARHAIAALQESEHATDPCSPLAAVSARLLASAGAVWAAVDTEGDQHLAAELWALRGSLADQPAPLRLPTALLAFESLFATGRVERAEELLDEVFAGQRWRTDPLPAAVDGVRIGSMPFLPVRLLFYTGRTEEAMRLLSAAQEAAREADDSRWVALGDALLGMCAAAVGDRSGLGAARRRVSARFTSPRDYVEASARAIIGYGLASSGRLDEAAVEIRAGGGPGLRRLQIVDRALSLEVLVQAELARGDLVAADRRSRELLPLTPHLAAGQIAARTFALRDLARGAHDAALDNAEVSLARSEAVGAFRETVRAELVRARALAALGRTGQAGLELQRVAESAERRGDPEARRQAGRQLRGLGRRVLPARGSGWAGLTEQEAAVARLVAEGYGNRAIGEALFLSPRTVQGSVTRVLIAFDAPRRVGLVARLRAEGTPGSGSEVSHPAEHRSEAAPSAGPADDTPAARGALTARQLEVVEHLVAGRSNTEIAQELGISPKTVERHVSAILFAWNVRSRSAAAHLALRGSV